jgi:hypothetical protein
MTMLIVLLMAIVVLVALYLKNSVTFHVQFLGARVQLEAKDKAK